MEGLLTVPYSCFQKEFLTVPTVPTITVMPPVVPAFQPAIPTNHGLVYYDILATTLHGEHTEPNQDPYCFVEFYDHESAAVALAAMNKRMCLGRALDYLAQPLFIQSPTIQSAPQAYHTKFDLAPSSTLTINTGLAGLGEGPAIAAPAPTFKAITLPTSTTRRFLGPGLTRMHPYYFVQYVPLDLKQNPEMKVNWVTSPSSQPKQDTSKHFHIFVGDLSPDIETHQLKGAFQVFGDISNLVKGVGDEAKIADLTPSGYATKSFHWASRGGGLAIIARDCKIIRDPQSLKSKGYGFVSFVNKQDAESAIASMNGQWLGNRPIRTNWATRKPPAPPSKETVKQLNYGEVMSQSSPTNCTVYCGGIINGLSEDLIRKQFIPYGTIQEIRVFKDKGYAFIRFSNKESAGQAICGVHGQVLNDQQVKCSWGKESNDLQQSQSSTPQMMGSQSPSQQYNSSGVAGYNNGMAGYNYNVGNYGYYPGYGAAQQGFNVQGAGYGYGYQYGSTPIQGQWGVQMQPGQPAPAYGPAGYQIGVASPVTLVRPAP